MKFNQSPLPFTGQKRNFLKHFKYILETEIQNQGDGWTIVDAFGGSGLLSHTAKQTLTKARVIYNDFDGYTERLAHIDDTNRLRRLIFAVLEHGNIAKNVRLPENMKAEIAAIIQIFDGYKDLNCIASWLLFSGKQAPDFDFLFGEAWYRKIRESDYPTANGYLNGVEIVRKNAHELIPEFADAPKALLVLDPPYVCTAQGSYRQSDYFGMVQFLQLMSVVRPPFIFFSSTRSELLDYLNFVIDFRQPDFERFLCYEKISIETALNKTARYEDNMVYKFQAA